MNIGAQILVRILAFDYFGHVPISGNATLYGNSI